MLALNYMNRLSAPVPARNLRVRSLRQYNNHVVAWGVTEGKVVRVVALRDILDVIAISRKGDDNYVPKQADHSNGLQTFLAQCTLLRNINAQERW